MYVFFFSFVLAENYFGHFGFHNTPTDTETAAFTICGADARGPAKMANCREIQEKGVGEVQIRNISGEGVSKLFYRSFA